MIRSMTGFGTATSTTDDETLDVEVRAVNHRFLDVKARLPRDIAALESKVTKKVRDALARGSIDVRVRRSESEGGSRVRLDLEVAREYVLRLQELAARLDLQGAPSLEQVAAADGVLTLEENSVDLERLGVALVDALGEALDRVIEMRVVEGKALAEDLTRRMQLIGTLVAEVEDAAPAVVTRHRDRLQARLDELAKGVDVDPARVAVELVVFADKSDVTEEVTRLQSHVEQFQKLLDGDEPVGRKLDFLVQEMNREVNTIGSKSQATEISERVVGLKAELERVREQVQNIE